jgi:hypothetical protein
MTHPGGSLFGLVALGMVSLAASVGCDGVPPSVPPTDGGLTFAVADESLRPIVEAAAARWAAATGLELAVHAGGAADVLVERSDDIPNDTGGQALGVTAGSRDHIWIHALCPSARCTEEQLEKTVLHEMGHALGGDHVGSMGVLSHHKGYAPVIDDASLTEVCAAAPCRAFNPEG